MQGKCVPFGVYRARRISFRTARHYAGCIGLAYTVIGREDQAQEILTRLREVETKCKHCVGRRNAGQDPGESCRVEALRYELHKRGLKLHKDQSGYQIVDGFGIIAGDMSLGDAETFAREQRRPRVSLLQS